MPQMNCLVICSVILLSISPALASDGVVTIRGRVVDAQSEQTLPARVEIRSDSGEWFFPKSADESGSAIEYRKQRQAGSVEMHTTLSGHPFVVELPAGKYVIAAERGKEYTPLRKTFEVTDQPLEIQLPLNRWIDMAKRGWYSGDTHVHRSLEELPNLLLAEDLNVALPLTYWVTKAYEPPASGDKTTAGQLRPEPIEVDRTHVIYPINTEYEIFTVDGVRHTLGAIFVLGHQNPFDIGAPPVKPIAARAREEGALLDLDKHSWPWSLMLVPVMDVDLFELANNHVWRTRFGFRQWTFDTLPEYMELETDDRGFTEWGWIDFGFQTYYALLNCGFRMRPTAGTASGVHPVPLGFGRVYVHQPDGFSYENWMRGLDAGRSFVTTGPMLFVEVDGRPPGSQVEQTSKQPVKISGSAESAVPLDRIEIVVNGEVVRTVKPQNGRTQQGGFSNRIDVPISLNGSSWVAVRVFESRADQRVRFAHSSPVHFDVEGKPLRPRKAEVAFFIDRMEKELARNRSVLPETALQEFEQALNRYRQIAKRARE